MLSSISTLLDVQALVVERADKSAKNMLCYTLDRDLFSGERYPTIEQPGPDLFSRKSCFCSSYLCFLSIFFFISSFVNLFIKGDAKYANDISLALSKILTSV